MLKSLPEEFTTLERFTERWILPSERARRDLRCQSELAELEDLYETMLVRMEAIIHHLNAFPIDNLPEAESNLFSLAQAFVEVAPAVELFRAPEVPDGFPWQRFQVLK